MISALEGIVRRSLDGIIQLEVGPVTLELFVPVVQTASLRAGDPAKLYTHLYFSSNADQLKLFGFTSPQARELFATLITGSGVGPKVALALFDLGVAGLVAAVRNGDEQALTSVPGVGPKLAKRIIVELSDKVTKGFSDVALPGEATAKNSTIEDAIDAVVALGFNRLSAERTVMSLAGDEQADDPAPLIRKALAKLSSGG